MPTPTIRFALDPTGHSVNNFVSHEPHSLAIRRVRAISLIYGPFFEESIIITEVGTNRVLTKSVDYVFSELLPTPTRLYGKAISGVILIINEAVLGNVEVTYQALGGAYSYSTDALVSLVQERVNDAPSINWLEVIGRPSEFTPTQHLHDAGDVYGFEYIVNALERVRNAILWSDSATVQALIDLMNSKLADIDGRFNTLFQAQFDIAIQSLALRFNKQTIGLGNVQNLSPASYSDGMQMANSTTELNSIALNKSAALDTLVGFRDKLLQYLVRSDTTGLGMTLPRTRNLTRANLAEMVNGATIVCASRTSSQALGQTFENSAYPTNSDQANAFTIVKLVNNSDNRGGIFLYAENNTNNLYIAKMDTDTSFPVFHEVVLQNRLDALVTEITNLIADHATNRNNPHSTTKDQVELGFVENLSCVTSLDLDLKRNVRKYVTLADLNYYSAKWLRFNTTVPPDGTTTYHPTINYKDTAGNSLGWAYALSDARDPRATVEIAESTGSIYAYAYPSSVTGVTKQVMNTAGVTICWFADTETITYAQVPITTNVDITAVPTSISGTETTTVTYVLNGLTPNKSYDLQIRLTDPSNVSGDYTPNGTPIVHTVTSSNAGSATYSFSFTKGSRIAGTWRFGVLITTQNELVTVNTTGGSIVIS